LAFPSALGFEILRKFFVLTFSTGNCRLFEVIEMEKSELRRGFTGDYSVLSNFGGDGLNPNLLISLGVQKRNVGKCLLFPLF
jgi:hypothetical protein